MQSNALLKSKKMDNRSQTDHFFIPELSDRHSSGICANQYKKVRYISGKNSKQVRSLWYEVGQVYLVEGLNRLSLFSSGSK